MLPVAATVPGSTRDVRRETRAAAIRADPPTIAEIVAVMRQAGDGHHGRRLRGLIVVLWRAGLRIHEALALSEADREPDRFAAIGIRPKR